MERPTDGVEPSFCSGDRVEHHRVARQAAYTAPKDSLRCHRHMEQSLLLAGPVELEAVHRAKLLLTQQTKVFSMLVTGEIPHLGRNVPVELLRDGCHRLGGIERIILRHASPPVMRADRRSQDSA